MDKKELSQKFQDLYGRMPTEKEIENLNKTKTEEKNVSIDSEVNYKKEIETLKQRLDTYEQTVNTSFFNRIKLTHSHWLIVTKFIMNNGLTNFLLIIIGVFVNMISLHSYPLSTKFYWYYILLILLIEYFYPLLSLKNRFPWDKKLEIWLKNTTYESIKDQINSISETTSKNLKLKEEPTKKSNVHHNPSQEESLNDDVTKEAVLTENNNIQYGKNSKYRPDFIILLLGIFELVGFFMLPFVKIDLPMVGNMSAKLYDLLTDANSITASLGLSSTSFQLALFILIICPLLCIICSFFQSKGAKVITTISSGINVAYIVYVIGKIVSTISENIPFNDDTDFSFISNYLGIGFWIVLIVPCVLFVWSIITLIWKTISTK